MMLGHSRPSINLLLLASFLRLLGFLRHSVLLGWSNIVTQTAPAEGRPTPPLFIVCRFGCACLSRANAMHRKRAKEKAAIVGKWLPMRAEELGKRPTIIDAKASFWR